MLLEKACTDISLVESKHHSRKLHLSKGRAEHPWGKSNLKSDNVFPNE
jgi:hypothetical protein